MKAPEVGAPTARDVRLGFQTCAACVWSVEVCLLMVYLISVYTTHSNIPITSELQYLTSPLSVVFFSLLGSPVPGAQARIFGQSSVDI